MTLDTLKSSNHFLVWRYETADKAKKPTKVPYSALDGFRVGTTAKYSSRWTSLEKAETAVLLGLKDTDFDGAGFVFHSLAPGADVCGIDIDGYAPDSEFVCKIADMFPNAYVETSPSGNGIHLVMLVDSARVPHVDKGGKKELDPKYYSKNPNNGVEAYVFGLTNRFFTFSGKTIMRGSDNDSTSEFLRFLDMYMTRKPKDAGPVADRRDASGEGQSILSDDEVLAKARNAANGAKFAALFDKGDTDGYESPSNADMGLMNILAFYTRRDREQMERLFGMSALGQRDKWQDRWDYRRMTVAKAVEDCKQIYEPPAKAAAREDFADWREPTPLDTITPPAMPLDNFPATIASYARELSEYTQTDPAMAGVSCLGVLGGVFQNKLAVQSVNGNIEQLSIYALKICAPAERKSEVDKHITRPLVKFSNRYNFEHRADISRSHHCPLAHMLRKRLHKWGIHTGFFAVFSAEPVRKGSMILCDETNKKSNTGTVSYMPAVFGCACASVVIRRLVNEL